MVAGCQPSRAVTRGSAGGAWPIDGTGMVYYDSNMRKHMSITIEEATAQRLRRYARRERRPVSQVVEIAVERLLEQYLPLAESIVTTEARFEGRFSREETYAGR